PLIGQLPEFANREPKPIPASEPAPLGPATISPLLWKWRCQLGTVFGLSIGPFQPLVIAEPDLFHQASTNQHDRCYERSASYSMPWGLGYGTLFGLSIGPFQPLVVAEPDLFHQARDAMQAVVSAISCSFPGMGYGSWEVWLVRGQAAVEVAVPTWDGLNRENLILSEESERRARGALPVSPPDIPRSLSPFSSMPPSLCPQILIAKSSSFQKNQNARRVVSFLANGLVFSDGAFWARQRKMISHAFSPSYLKVSGMGLVGYGIGGMGLVGYGIGGMGLVGYGIGGMGLVGYGIGGMGLVGYGIGGMGLVGYGIGGMGLVGYGIVGQSARLASRVQGGELSGEQQTGRCSSNGGASSNGGDGRRKRAGRCSSGFTHGVSAFLIHPFIPSTPPSAPPVQSPSSPLSHPNLPVPHDSTQWAVMDEQAHRAEQQWAHTHAAVTAMDEQARRAVQQWVHTWANGPSQGVRSTAAKSSGASHASSDEKEMEEEGQGESEERRAEEEGRSVREVYEAVSTLSTGSTERFFSGRFLIPFYTWLPTQENSALQQAAEKVTRLSLDLIARRRQEQAGDSRKDLLAVMLAARDDVSNEQMTDQQLVDECVTFLLAGHETTAKLLTWAVYLLARYPDWQRRVREEVWRVMGSEMPEGGGGGGGANREGGGEKLELGGEKGEGGGEGEKEEGGGEAAKGNGRRGGGRKVTWEQVGRLSEMHMVLLETLRLFPPTPVITREAVKHVSLGPYSLPAGTRITMAIGMAQSDPRFWGEDALEFNPLRFKDGIQGACSHPQAFLPFSAGPRDCIGSNFALSEAKVVLAHMLSRLEWELSPTYVHLPTMGIALSPKYGMPLRMRLVE
ncbi:unnamed protein product, partial [Closterium sp. NIES-64]